MIFAYHKYQKFTDIDHLRLLRANLYYIYFQLHYLPLFSTVLFYLIILMIKFGDNVSLAQKKQVDNSSTNTKRLSDIYTKVHTNFVEYYYGKINFRAKKKFHSVKF